MDIEKLFIKWAQKHKYNLRMDNGYKLFINGELEDIDITLQNKYSSTHTQSAWEAWQEAFRITNAIR